MISELLGHSDWKITQSIYKPIVELKYTDNYSSFKNIICEINKEIKKYNKTPLFLAQYKWKG